MTHKELKPFGIGLVVGLIILLTTAANPGTLYYGSFQDDGSGRSSFLTSVNMVPSTAKYDAGTLDPVLSAPSYILPITPNKNYWIVVTNANNFVDDGSGTFLFGPPGGLINTDSNHLYIGNFDGSLVGKPVQEGVYDGAPINALIAVLQQPSSFVSYSVLPYTQETNGFSTNQTLWGASLRSKVVNSVAPLTLSGTSGTFELTATAGNFTGWQRGDQFVFALGGQYAVVKVEDATHIRVATTPPTMGPLTRSFTNATIIQYYPLSYPIYDASGNGGNVVAGIQGDGTLTLLNQDNGFANSGCIMWIGSGIGTFSMNIGIDGSGLGIFNMLGNAMFSVATNAPNGAFAIGAGNVTIGEGFICNSNIILKPVSAQPAVAATVGANGFVLWNSNGILYCTKSANGSTFNTSTLLAQ